MWSIRHEFEVRGTDNGMSEPKREIRWYISDSCLIVEDQNSENSDFVRWINPLSAVCHLKLTHRDGRICKMQFQVISGSAGNLYVNSPEESEHAAEFEAEVKAYFHNR